MSALEALKSARRLRKTRPVHYEELLLEPIAVRSTDASKPAANYVGWERDHIEAKRFYVTGFDWFESISGLNITRLNTYRDEGQRLLIKGTTWHEMYDPNGSWQEVVGKPQTLRADKKQPLSFPKAAQVIMTCEAALTDLMSKPASEVPRLRLPAGFDHPQHLHGFMGILPAVWNIDDFTEAYLRSHGGGDGLQKLCTAANLTSQQAVRDLSKGFTVTHATALSIRQTAMSEFKTAPSLGIVRPTPGRLLGTKAATSEELPNLG